MDQTLVVSYGAPGPGPAMARIVAVRQQTWRDYARTLVEVPVGADKSVRGWSIPAKFSPSYRDGENFVARYALTFDYDHLAQGDIARVFVSLENFEYLAYTTFSHTDDRPRWRVVLPLGRPATYDEFQAVSRRIAARSDIELAARESHVPAQMMFLPVCRDKDVFHRRHNPGAWVDVDAVLAEYDDWTDRAQWPHRRDADAVHEHGVWIDPTEKPGVVGEFCRAYTVEQAIEKFELPYVRVR